MPGVVGRTTAANRTNNITACPLIGAPACVASPACTARASRSRSSTPASTTRTPTSAARARWRPTTRRTPPRPPPADPALFGPTRREVKGGIDLVGDNYNADPSTTPYQPIPHPDPNPLDCNGHGSHVAGTAAGFGVLSTGATYTGAVQRDAPTANSRSTSARASRRRRTCTRSACSAATARPTSIVDAIDWAVDNDMDVINMSLGSPFGSADDPSAVAATNAAKAGVVVVDVGRQRGPSPYITGSPGTGTGVIASRRSTTTRRSFPGARSRWRRRRRIDGDQRQRRADLDGSPLTDRAVARRPATPVERRVARLQRSPHFRRPASPPATHRRRPARHLRARGEGDLRPAGRCSGGRHGEQRTALPPFEGPITEPRRRRAVHDVTIPFLGVGAWRRRRLGRLRRLRRARRQCATRSPTIANPASRLRELQLGRSAHRRQRRSSRTSPRPASASSRPVCGTGNAAAILRARRWRRRTSRASRRSTGRRIRRGTSRTSRPRS